MKSSHTQTIHSTTAGIQKQNFENHSPWVEASLKALYFVIEGYFSSNHGFVLLLLLLFRL